MKENYQLNQEELETKTQFYHMENHLQQDQFWVKRKEINIKMSKNLKLNTSRKTIPINWMKKLQMTLRSFLVLKLTDWQSFSQKIMTTKMKKCLNWYSLF